MLGEEEITAQPAWGASRRPRTPTESPEKGGILGENCGCCHLALAGVSSLVWTGAEFIFIFPVCGERGCPIPGPKSWENIYTE